MLYKKITLLFVILVFFIAPIGIQLNTSVNNIINEQHELNSNKLVNLQIIPLFAHAQEVATCDTFDFFCHFVDIAYLVLVGATQLLVIVSAFILDILLSFSITSSSYRGTGFIEIGWEILRDFTNIVFIFALLLVAFKMVLGSDDGKTKKTLVRTILIALTINFSLFFSYIIVDASNLLAYVFYNNISAPESEITYENGRIESKKITTTSTAAGTTTSTSTTQSGISTGTAGSEKIGKKSISLAIASKINPQDGLNNLKGTQDTARFFSIIIVGLINLAFTYVFFSVALLFLGRTLGIMVLAVLSPIAFASRTIGQENLSYVGWNYWFKELLSLSFMAPIFLFFIYLATLFQGIANNIPRAGANDGIIETTLAFVLPLLVTLSLIMLAKKVSTKMAGEIGGQISSYAQKAIGGAVAVGSIAATGGAALAGGVLRGAGMVAQATGRTNTANRLQGLGQRAQATNFNFAQTRLGKVTSKTTGINMGEKLGNLSYARADTATRRGANNLRAGIDNIRTGRTPESVQNWQDSVQESRDNLTQTRIENRQRQRAEDETLGVANIRGYVPDGTEINNNAELLQNLQARLARRTSDEARAERDQLDEQRNNIQLDIDALQDTINNLARNNQNGQNTDQIRDLRGELNNLRRDQRRVDETSLEGQITQVQRVINDEANTARANMLTDDMNNRRVTQNASMTIDTPITTTRRERMDAQAARVGGNQIRTDGGRVGGDANQGNTNT